MKKIVSFLLPVLLMFALFSCDTGKQLSKTSQTAQQAFNQGDYSKALGLWEEVINNYKQKGEEAKCPVYTDAGIAAYKLGNIDKAIDCLKQAKWSDFSKEETYLTLAEIYRKKDNLSMELVNLENFLDKYPNSPKRSEVRKRLFVLYQESDNFEKGEQLWDSLSPQSQNDEALLEAFLLMNEKQKNDKKCQEISEQLLTQNKNNAAALRWLANNTFWKTEKHYQEELKAYEKHKTRKQYAHLLKELKTISADYKTALSYAKQLYAIDPTPETALLISKCYNRLDDKKKAAYYKSLANK